MRIAHGTIPAQALISRIHHGATPVGWLISRVHLIAAPAGRLLGILHRGLVGPLLEAVLPADCPGCGADLPGVNRAGLCDACWKALAPVPPPLCAQCGIGLPSLGGEHPDARSICGPCVVRRPAFDGTWCALALNGPSRALLHLYKFGHRPDLARTLSRFVLEILPSAEAFDLITPVPLHWTRRLARGHDQARLLASALSRGTGRPLDPLLIKPRRTADQTRLDAVSRSRNLRGAFALRNPRRRLRGIRVLLVDDILTTGATADACARLLKTAGASRVLVAAVARTPAANISSLQAGRTRRSR